MDRQKDEPQSTEPQLASGEVDLASTDKAWPVVQNTPSCELHPDNGMAVPRSTGVSFSKDRLPTADATWVSAMRGSSLECPSLHQTQSESSVAANSHFVYVRRRPETEASKASNFDGGRIAPDCQLSSPQDPKLPSQTKEPEYSLSRTLAPIASSGGKPSTSGQGMSNFKSASLGTDNGCGGTAFSVDNIKRMKLSHWEERFYHLQQLLRSLDQSDRKDYLQMLRSLSSVELNRHAVELEKRSIQLSLKEAKEIQRMEMLNVLSKSNG